MIQFVDFVSRVEIERMAGNPGMAVISVTDSDAGDALIHPDFGRVLRLRFDDLDDEALRCGSTGKVFGEADARQIVDFLVALQHEGMPSALVHCEAGRSRSAAIALFISGACAAKFAFARRIDGWNERVVALLERAAGVQVGRPSSMMVQPGDVVGRLRG